MHLLSVNIGEPRKTTVGSVGVTGIYKEPVSGSVYISKGGVAGDTVSDTSCHGGVDQAVYVYTGGDYEWWSERLGYVPEPGAFGENLTISNLLSQDIFIGDRIEVGAVVLEVTCPRIPCATFADKMGDPAFVKKFKEGERPGFYCRVLQEGSVKAGDTVFVKHGVDPNGVSLMEFFRDYYDRSQDRAVIERFLRAPIAVRSRAKLEKRLMETAL